MVRGKRRGIVRGRESGNGWWQGGVRVLSATWGGRGTEVVGGGGGGQCSGGGRGQAYLDHGLLKFRVFHRGGKTQRRPGET